jgi:hypothetical protein
MIRVVAPHRVVVGAHHSGTDEDVVLEHVAREIDVGLDPGALADQHVRLDDRSAAERAEGPDPRALAHERLVADDHAPLEHRAGTYGHARPSTRPSSTPRPAPECG